MASTNRLIILLCVVGVLACFAGSALLMPRIKAQRIELQYTQNEDITKNLPPEYATWYIALGAFRGPMLNYMWIRLEDMKSEGKFWEMKQLSEQITRLQPRSPMVWENRAWNLAYNISVMTHTARERWFWVSSGLKLLQNEGLVHNPNSLILYKELAWIYLHKIGMFSDDFHNYYKAKLAEEWHFLLGEPAFGDADAFGPDGKVILRPDPKDPEKLITQREYAAITEFRPIAYIYDKYVNHSNTPRAVNPILKTLVNDPYIGKDVREFAELPALRMLVKARRVRQRLLERNPEYALRLDPLLAILTEMEERTGDPLDRFLAGEPECEPLWRKISETGREPGRDLVMEIGRMRAAILLSAPQAADANPVLQEIFGDPELEAIEKRDLPAAKLLAFLRAHTLEHDYNMNPIWMLELMEGTWFVHPDQLPELEKNDEVPAIPLDWRVHGAHGLYWAALGVKRSQGFLNPEQFDILNTDRLILMGLQSMMHHGKIFYDPFSGIDGGYYRRISDTRYIDAYHFAVFSSVIRNPKERLRNAAITESFQAGHENFLIRAVQELFLAGDKRRAERYYDLLRKNFTSRDGRNIARFSKPIEVFVEDEINRDVELMNDDLARAMVANFLFAALDHGLAQNDPMGAAAKYKEARKIYDLYQSRQEKRVDVGPDQIQRMMLPPFEDLFTIALENYMTVALPSSAIRIKLAAWRYVDNWYKRRIYDRIKGQLAAECQRVGLDPAKTFPEPPGMAEFRANPSSPDPRPQSPFLSEIKSGQR